MILNDFLNYRQPQARAILLAVAHKGMEQLVADRVRHARAIIRDGYRNRPGALANHHLNLSAERGGGFAGVEQQIVQGTLQFMRIEPSRALAVAVNLDRPAM